MTNNNMRYTYQAIEEPAVVLEIDSEEEEDASASFETLHGDFEEDKDFYDTQFLHRAIEDAGRWAFGVVLVELWVLEDTGTRLFRPDRGWWIDQYADKDAKFSRLTDESLPDYIPADPVMPGIGLSGYLWSQATGQCDGSPRQSIVERLSILGGRRSTFSRKSFHVKHAANPRASGIFNRISMLSDGGGSQFGPSDEKLTWCEVKPLANDPLQPYDERTQYLAKAGLGLAAGVPFNIAGTRGIVVYMARDTASLNDLTDKTNEAYLQRATSVIASSYALRRARIEVVRKRKQDISACWRRLRMKLLAIRFMGLDLAEVVHREEQKKVEQRPQSIRDVIRKADGSFETVLAYFNDKWSQQVTKFKGANIHAPPPFGWYQSFFTFMGCFLTLAMLANVSNIMVDVFGPDHAILLPPFGALMALQYGLTSAPASQPLQAVSGQIIGLTIAHLTGTYLDAEIWLKQSLSTALAIAVMVRLGVLHPPAAASAIVFASGKMSWVQGVMILFGDVLAIFAATFINNWDERRQYPTFWGLRPINDFLSSVKEKKAKKETRTKADDFSPKRLSSNTICTETTAFFESSESTIDFIE